MSRKVSRKTIIFLLSLATAAILVAVFLPRYAAPVVSMYRKCGSLGLFFDPTEMAPVPAGEFIMGCNEAVDAVCQADEFPSHRVYLDPYWIDRYEASWSVYRKCAQAGACEKTSAMVHGAANDPVTNVTYEQASRYCVWLGKRLPTEAEWEKAARGVDGRIFPWGNEYEPHNFNGFDQDKNSAWGGVIDGWAKEAPVYCLPNGKSPYGAINMLGNVWEWTSDWYDGLYYRSSPERNPTGPATGKEKVVRGGGWHLTFGNDIAPYRCSDRDNGYAPNDKSDVLGFRCALSTPPKKENHVAR